MDISFFIDKTNKPEQKDLIKVNGTSLDKSMAGVIKLKTRKGQSSTYFREIKNLWPHSISAKKPLKK